MTLIPKADIVAGASLSEDGGVIHEVERVFDVTGIIGQPGSQVLEFGLATSAGIPGYGNPHPTIAGLYASRRRVTPLGPLTTRATITYDRYAVPNGQTRGIPRYRLGGNVDQIDKAYDVNGNAITVQHIGTDTIGDLGVPVLVILPVSASVPDPYMIFSIDRDEIFTPASPVLSLIQTYLGKVNSVNWAGGAPGQWLAQVIGAEPIDFGLNFLFKVQYEFRWKVIGWQPFVAWANPVNGLPPVGATFNNGVESKFVNAIPGIDFTALALA